MWANLIQRWLMQVDRGELVGADAEAAMAIDHETKIVSLQSKVGQLTMELDLLKKTRHLRPVTGSETSSRRHRDVIETSSIISGPQAAPSGGGAK